MNHSAIHLLDLISKEKLDEFLRVFTEVTGIASIITDTEGQPITHPHNFTSFCHKYCRSTEEGLRRCYKSDRFGGQKSARLKKRFIYKCLNAGLTDFATPIIVEGYHLANVLCGQVITEPIDPAQAIENARAIGITDTDGYLKAMETLPSMSHKRLETIANLMEVITHTISELALKKYFSHKHSRQYLDKLVNSVSDGIISTDTEAKITMVNEACVSLFGREEKELMGQSVLTLFSDEASVKNYREQMAVSLKSKGRAVLTALRADKHSFPVQISLAGISDEAGENSGYVAVLRDVSEEKNMERMKEDLIGMLTHDMGNPVLSIQKALQLLVDGALGPLNSGQKEVMTLALGTSHQLFGMVTDFLDIYRDENGHFLLYKSRIDINQIAGESIRHLRFLAHDKTISVRFEPCETLLKIPGDQNRLMRVCTNLLENAIKYSPEGGEISISLTAVNTDHREIAEKLVGRSRFHQLTSGHPYALMSISDQGPGIPEEYRHAIFDKFFTIKSRNEKRRKGMGLGLAFCKLAIEAHGGLIWQESPGGIDGAEKNRGCRFHFILPCDISG